MSWIGVVTDAGAALLAQWASGSHVLHISGATVGSGTRPEANLRAATDLIAEEDDAQIVSVKTVDSNQQQIRIRVNAIDGTSYTAKEIGVWAHLDSDQTETLLQIHQDTTGVLIPTAAEIPGFYFDLYSRMIVDGDGEIDVTIAQEAYATQDDIQKYEDGNRFAVCTSSMSASTKTITVDSMPFDLNGSNDPPNGSTIKVLFQNGNSSSNPTIKITDGVKTTSARDLVLYKDGYSVTAADELRTGGLYEIVFVSPYWVIATAGFDQFVRDKLNDYFTDIFFLQKGLAVRAEDEDTHASIQQGQYVLLTTPGTLPTGLYKATTAIPANGKLTSSNVTAVSSGGLNDLKDQIDTLNSNLSALSAVSTSAPTKHSSITDGTLDSAYIRKVGNTVFASGRLHSFTARAASGYFFMIPEGYRPQSLTRIEGSISIVGTGFVPLLVGVYPNGIVEFSYSSSSNTNQVSFAGSWSVI